MQCKYLYLLNIEENITCLHSLDIFIYNIMNKTNAKRRSLADNKTAGGFSSLFS